MEKKGFKMCHKNTPIFEQKYPKKLIFDNDAEICINSLGGGGNLGQKYNEKILPSNQTIIYKYLLKNTQAKKK